MSGAQHGPGGITDRAAVTAAGTTTTGTTTSADAESAAPATDATDSPAPLTSLTSLLGGMIESGTTCAADGSCD